MKRFYKIKNILERKKKVVHTDQIMLCAEIVNVGNGQSGAKRWVMNGFVMGIVEKKMIKVFKYNFGDYNQKLIMDRRKVVDAECTCHWGRNNQKAWKRGEPICKHLKSAMERREIEISNDARKINRKKEM